MALTIGPKRQLEVRSAVCVRCGQILRRGYLVRHVEGEGEAHVDCLPGTLGSDILHAMNRIGPSHMAHIAREASVGINTARKRLAELQRAGVVRRAGDFWRINARYPNLKAALAAWRAHDPS